MTIRVAVQNKDTSRDRAISVKDSAGNVKVITAGTEAEFHIHGSNDLQISEVVSQQEEAPETEIAPEAPEAPAEEETKTEEPETEKEAA